jgi:hypothetical protein
MGYWAIRKGSTSEQSKQLLDQVRDLPRIKSYSYRTEQSCVGWIKRIILFRQKRHPKEMGDWGLKHSDQ